MAKTSRPWYRAVAWGAACLVWSGLTGCGSTATTVPDAANIMVDVVDYARVSDFESRFKSQATDPVVAAYLWFEAALVYSNADAVATGRDMLDRYFGERTWEQDGTFAMAVHRQPYLFDSYLVGATPDNDYQPQLTDGRFELDLRGSQADSSPGYWKLRLNCSGADSQRPCTLKRGTDGLWRMWEYSSIYVGIRPPV